MIPAPSGRDVADDIEAATARLGVVYGLVDDRPPPAVIVNFKSDASTKVGEYSLDVSGAVQDRVGDHFV
jgi:hypothetical protein